ncbi:MAG TPA: DUF1648 domain-containing protein [candidate division Zixibacteria bacterium]|nr:DUF1648 domain-containing protein [candidate division Zixibacteria bacterium]HOD66238.1 DUF1648 domain-containing protein [candidate division Zixibacteria bacterium]HOZ06705.1 DUF1648 domain-containing protein [candidate division Zixibacteria bacterium]HPI32466.1 DUF1648 domain-containing protein [candidate division Zixibacteria bacterium]HPM36700.1 DUF1648 domain-containing protein [candidate division Zixibacteria bacterium]
MEWLPRLWLLSVAALLFQAAYYWPRLPERLASHFDASGVPNGYSSRASFIAVWLAVVLLVNIWPAIIGPLIRKLPPGLINTPRKDYWLATQERRTRLIAIVAAMLSGIMLGANVMLLVTFHYTAAYNTGGRGSSGSWIGYAVVAETLLTLGAVVWGLVTLSRPPADFRPQPPS